MTYLNDVQTLQKTMDGRTFFDVDFLPSPCNGCGVCCKHFRVSFYHGEASDLGLDDRVTKISPFLVAMKGTEKGFGKCSALLDTGKCGIYDKRPSPCREYPLYMEDGSLNPECVRLRLLYNVDNDVGG